ncbi:MAG: hypothetical protein RLZZ186_1828 [Cyanobacteriota bacterium]|jgi:hypothetical protein
MAFAVNRGARDFFVDAGRPPSNDAGGAAKAAVAPKRQGIAADARSVLAMVNRQLTRRRYGLRLRQPS